MNKIVFKRNARTDKKEKNNRITITAAFAAHISYMVDNFSVSYIIIHKIILEKRFKKKKKKINSWNSIWHPVRIQFSNYVLTRRINLFSWSPFPLQGRDLVLISHTSQTPGVEIATRLECLTWECLTWRTETQELSRIHYLTQKSWTGKTWNLLPSPLCSSSLYITPAWPFRPALHSRSLIISGLLIFQKHCFLSKTHQEGSV